MEDGRLNASNNVPLNNCACASVVFPKTPNQITCFENPMLEGLQLKIDNKFLPIKAYSTTSPRFLQEQLIIADLDGGLQPTKEYIDSLIQERNDTKTKERRINTVGDCSSFIALFQTERADAGFTYDGIDTGGSNVDVEIKGTSKYTGFTNGVPNDTYYYPNPNSLTEHPPVPQLWLESDTYFSVQPGKGLTYHRKNAPPGSQIGDY
jgi:hypothetical protein